MLKSKTFREKPDSHVGVEGQQFFFLDKGGKIKHS
jgi:hypothetical protein